MSLYMRLYVPISMNIFKNLYNYYLKSKVYVLLSIIERGEGEK